MGWDLSPKHHYAFKHSFTIFMWERKKIIHSLPSSFSRCSPFVCVAGMLFHWRGMSYFKGWKAVCGVEVILINFDMERKDSFSCFLMIRRNEVKTLETQCHHRVMWGPSGRRTCLRECQGCAQTSGDILELLCNSLIPRMWCLSATHLGWCPSQVLCAIPNRCLHVSRVL